MTFPPSSNRKIIASVQRALDILDLFTTEQTELGNIEIARLLELPVGTVSGLVYTLKVNRYLDQNPSNRKYRLGLKLAERAEALLQSLDLRRAAAPFLEELRDWCGESVNLAVRDHHVMVYIERMFGSHALGIRSEIGMRGPLHSTALGKALLAHLPPSERVALLETYSFVFVTPFTITDPAAFSRELQVISARGYAVDEQENELGGRCVAAPVFNHRGYPVAAISISVPVQRMTGADVARFGARVQATALQISQILGYHCPE